MPIRKVVGTDGKTKLRYAHGGSASARQSASAQPQAFVAPGGLSPGRLVPAAPPTARLEWCLAVAPCAQRLVDALGARAFFRLEATSRTAKKTARAKPLVVDLASARHFGEAGKPPELDVEIVRSIRRLRPRCALVGARAARRAHRTWDDVKVLCSALPDCVALSLALSRLSGAPARPQLRALASLTKLDVSSTDVSGGLEHYACLTNLADLDVSHCRELDGPTDPLLALVNLRRLGMAYCDNISARASGAVLALFSGLRSRGGDDALRLRGTGPFRYDGDAVDAAARSVAGGALNLGRCEVAGSLAPFGLPGLGLGALDLSGSRELRGTLADLRACRFLRALNLHGCAGVTGPLDGLEKLSALVDLDLGGASVDGRLDALAELPLERLDLRGCRRLKGPLSRRLVRTLASLAARDLRGAGPFGLPDGAGDDLEALALATVDGVGDAARLLGPAPLSLTAVHLEGGHLTGTLAPFGAAVHLRRLRVDGCWHLRGDLEPLAAVRDLRDLALLGGKNLSGSLAGLRGLARLEALSLDGAVGLSGALDELFEGVGAPRPALRRLSLDGCVKLGGALEPLAHCAALEYFSARRCARLEGGVGAFGRCRALAFLALADCEGLAGPLAPLGGCGRLVDLNIARTAIGGPLAPLAGLARLRVLDVSGAETAPNFAVAGPVPPALLRRVRSLDLSFAYGVEGARDSQRSRAPGVVAVDSFRAAFDANAARALADERAAVERAAAAAAARDDARARRDAAGERDRAAADRAAAAARAAEDARVEHEERVVGAEIMADNIAGREADAY